MQTKFVNKNLLAASLWGIKWAKRNIKGEIILDDISIVDDETQENILDNGDFSGAGRNYDIFLKNSLIAGYGNCAESVKFFYQFTNLKNRKIFRSPWIQQNLSRENKEISSQCVQLGYNGFILRNRFSLAAGSPERISFFLKSIHRDLLKNVVLSVIVPDGIRLFPPPVNTVSPAPNLINETIISRNGKKFHEYTMEVDPLFINRDDTTSNMACLLSFFIVADTPERGMAGNLEYKVSSRDFAETNYHSLPLEVLPPLHGYTPSAELPLVLWAYATGQEITASLSDSEKRLLFEKAKAAGFIDSAINITCIF